MNKKIKTLIQLHNYSKTIHRFLFSTSSTSSSVENCPFTTRISCLIISSVQSTSRRPPTTTGSLDGFTCKVNEGEMKAHLTK